MNTWSMLEVPCVKQCSLHHQRDAAPQNLRFTVILEMFLCVAGLWGLHSAAILVVSLNLTLQPKWLGVHTQEDASTSLPFNCKKTPNYVNKFPNYHLLTVLCLSYASPCLQMSSICGIAGSRQCWILHCVLSMQLLTALAQGKLMPSVTQSLPFLSLTVAEEKYLTPGF